jgi:hypothetical protein
LGGYARFDSRLSICNAHIYNFSKVVNQESGLLGDGFERRGFIRADHANMAKFDNPAEEGYIQICGVIEEMIEKPGEIKHAKVV